jgi:malic enzyme
MAAHLPGVIAAMRITRTKVSDHKFLFQGAGEVGPNVFMFSLSCLELINLMIIIEKQRVTESQST